MKKQYVAILSVGPVQGFISAARRSRDLWSGSWLLSELAKACALSLQQQGADLIFPAIQDQSELKENSDLSVGNKIQVLITAEDAQQVAQLLATAKKATIDRFVREAEAAKKALNNDHDLRLDIWAHQLHDYVEVQSAWALIDEAKPTGYKDAVTLATSVLASRKATRDFQPSMTDPYQSNFMLPKSSLDGARETVIQEDKKIKNKTRLKLSLSASEQLDCAGVVKRLGLAEKAEQFTPFTRVAAHAWVEQAAQDTGFSAVLDSYEQLVKLDLATRVKGNQGIYKDFPYDAEYLYESRLDTAIREYCSNSEHCSDSEIATVFDQLKKALRPLWKAYGQPYSYGVLLLADGDCMGELLDQAVTMQQHQKITIALSKFAGDVPQLMRKYHGHCIYSGGDDVLGFVPLHQAYDCSKALSVLFEQALAEAAAQLKVQTAPTLSVGLAICHTNTPLSVIRELAGKAEKYAKGDHCSNANERRNALGIILSVRSGTDTSLRLGWNDLNAHESFKQWVNLYVNKNIPTRVAYDMREIHLRTEKISKDTALLNSIRAAELTRMLKNTRLVTSQTVDKEIIQRLNERALDIGLQPLSDELIVARWFAAKLQKDLGKE